MADINSLVLLRNDPELAARLVAQALAGEVDAQYAVGLIYAEGRGLEQDDVQAYYWLTRAVEQGDEDAERLRRVIASRLDDAGFARAKHLLQVSAAGRPGDAPSSERLH